MRAYVYSVHVRCGSFKLKLLTHFESEGVQIQERFIPNLKRRCKKPEKISQCEKSYYYFEI